MPENEPIAATAGALLLQLPPVAASLKTEDPPTQIFDEPAMANIGFTTIEEVIVQPVGAA